MTHVRQGQERSQWDTNQELSSDQDLFVGGKELHKDDRDNTDKRTEHGPLVPDSVDDPPGGPETDQLARFGDLLED
jgi:hypothetical protein